MSTGTHDPVPLTDAECRAHLSSGAVGRMAFTTPDGMRIVPASYTVLDEALIFRVSPYSEMAVHAPGAEVAVEVDELDHHTHQGWSVVAVGVVEVVDDPDAIHEVRSAADPTPWAAGSRQLYLRLRWRELTGRRLGHLADRSSTPARDEDNHESHQRRLET